MPGGVEGGLIIPLSDLSVLPLSALLFSAKCLKRILNFSAKCCFVSRYGSDHLLNTAHAVIVADFCERFKCSHFYFIFG